MKQIGKTGEYHAVIIGQPDGTSSYTIYDRQGRIMVTASRAGSENEVAKYLKRTTMKRYNSHDGGGFAQEYFNTTKITDAEEARNAILA